MTTHQYEQIFAIAAVVKGAVMALVLAVVDVQFLAIMVDNAQ